MKFYSHIIDHQDSRYFEIRWEQKKALLFVNQEILVSHWDPWDQNIQFGLSFFEELFRSTTFFIFLTFRMENDVFLSNSIRCIQCLQRAFKIIVCYLLTLNIFFNKWVLAYKMRWTSRKKIKQKLIHLVASICSIKIKSKLYHSRLKL